MGLLRQFEGMQLPAASELDWLVPEHDAPQKVMQFFLPLADLSSAVVVFGQIWKNDCQT